MPGNRFNPFRAFLIVNRITSTIVSVNRQACEYFWYTESELKNKSIESLLVDEKASSVIADSFLSQQNGQTKILAGKIVSVLLGTGERARFSLFIQDLDGDPSPLRFYAFEPIHTMQTRIICDREGAILNSDSHFPILFHNTMIDGDRTREIQHIGDLIPTLKDRSKFKQLSTQRLYRTTGLLNSEKKLTIPITMTLSKAKDDQMEVNLTVTSNISGLIMLDEAYTIRAYNPYFVQCLLGYRSLDLINHVSTHDRSECRLFPFLQRITEIIPDFNECQSTQSNDLSISISHEHGEGNLSCQSLIGDDEPSTSDGSSNTLNDSSIDTTPHSSRVLSAVENKVTDEKPQPNAFLVDKRLSTAGKPSFKTTSTPVAKSTLKSETKVDAEEHTGLPMSVSAHNYETLLTV